MTSTLFLTAGDVDYTVRVRPVLAPKDTLNVQVTTRSRAARDPEAERVSLNITVTRAELQALIGGLQAGLDASA